MIVWIIEVGILWSCLKDIQWLHIFSILKKIIHFYALVLCTFHTVKFLLGKNFI